MNISFISNQVWLLAALHEPSYLCHLYFVGCLIPNTISSFSSVQVHINGIIQIPRTQTHSYYN